MSLEQYQVLWSSALFVQAPMVEISKEPVKPLDRIITILKALNTSTIPSEQRYRTFIQLSLYAKEALTLKKALKSPTEVIEMYQLWELRLASLLFANELQLAQQEAKRLSTALDGIVKLSSPATKHSSLSSSAVLLFPSNVPLSLKFLLIRLRNVGPSIALLNDYYLQLWDSRASYLKNKDSLSFDIIHVLAFSISATLIAKREYFTFLTHSDSIWKSIDNTESSEFGIQLTLLSMLVSLIIGDADLAISYFDRLKDHLPSVLPKLQFIMNSVNPVLINKNIETETLKLDNVALDSTNELEDFIELVKNKRITGRILCSLCALFELDIRGANGYDSFNSTDENLPRELSTISRELFSLWGTKTNKVYCFE